jgi:hypothetical protein
MEVSGQLHAVRQSEMHTTESIPDRSSLEVEITIEKMEKCKWRDIDHILAKLNVLELTYLLILF